MMMRILSTDKYWLLTSLIMSGYFLINLINYEAAILSTNYYLEPAENEQLVFSFIYNSKYNATFDEYIEHGVLPIYPNLYFDAGKVLTFFSENLLQNMRLLNVTMHSIMTILFGVFTFNQSRSLPLAVLLPTILYGSSEHLSYFLMARPDGMYFFFGFLAILLYISLTSLHRVKTSFFAPIALLATLSLLTKQSGIYFAVLISTIIALDFLQRKNFRIKFFIILPVIPIFATINFIFFPYSWSSFTIGLEIYASDISYVNIKHQIIGGYRYAPLGLSCLAILALGAWREKDRQVSYAICLILTVAFSGKLFSNVAAFSNNYILLTSFTCLIVACGYRDFKFKSLIMLFTSITFLLVHTEVDKFQLQSRLTKFTSKITHMGPLEENELFSYIRENPGPYLTGRNDNYLIFSGNDVMYEGSVLDYVLRDDYQNPAVANRIDAPAIKKKISSMIKAKDFSGVVVGIGQWTLKNYPELQDNYTIKFRKFIDVGNHPHEIQLWVPSI